MPRSGQILKDIFRTDDIVARVGGDEFVAFLSGSDNASMAQEKAQELLDQWNEENMGSIELDEQSRAFVERMGG